MITLLVIALMGQFKESPLPPVAEIGFQVAQEDFIIATSLCKYPDKLFADLGSSKWKIRESANKKLFNYFYENPGEVRWLLWGIANRDQEIRYRCNKILRILNVCECCEGKGKYTKSQYDNYSYDLDCETCDGIGNFWELYLWR